MTASLCAHRGCVMVTGGAYIQPNISTYARDSGNCPDIVRILPRLLGSFELHYVEKIVDGGPKKNLASCGTRANLSYVAALKNGAKTRTDDLQGTKRFNRGETITPTAGGGCGGRHLW
jgi:hypothetical protein